MNYSSLSSILYFILCSFTCLAGDWSQWWHDTPGKNEILNQNINDVHRNIFQCKIIESKSLQFIEKWYFINDHIVGEFEKDQSNKSFIIDEKNCTIDTFKNNIDFETVLKQKKLKPFFWKRWYNDNWGFFFVGNGYGGFWDFLFIRGTWLSFPILIGIIISLIYSLKNKNFLWYFGLGIVIISTLRVLLDLFPQSI